MLEHIHELLPVSVSPALKATTLSSMLGAGDQPGEDQREVEGESHLFGLQQGGLKEVAIVGKEGQHSQHEGLKILN